MKKLLFFLSMTSMLFLFSCDQDTLTPDKTFISDQEVKTRAHLGSSAYVSSNNSSTLGIYAVGAAVANPASIDLDQRFLTVPYADADGVVYDENRNAVYQVNRSGSTLMAIANIDAAQDGDMVTPSTAGPMGSFSNGREATLYNNKVVVADDVTPGKLTSFHVNTSNISNYRSHQLTIEVWGIQMVGKDLWAVEDASPNLHLYADFFKAKSGDLASTSSVEIEGLIRTHGLSYDEHNDIMTLTDIGSAASDSDGGLIIINDFQATYAAAVAGSGVITMSDQVRIYGPSTTLGNPVDVFTDGDQGAIFVAERANGGGKFLVFEIPAASGEFAPVYSADFMGASAVTVE